MRMIRLGTTLISACLAVGAQASEPVCYSTADAAARQAGKRGVEGFRLEGVSRDVFSGLLWATVRNCQSPEQPAQLMLVPGGAVAWVAPTPLSTVLSRVNQGKGKEIVVRAGVRVQVVELGENVRMEMAAVALANAGVGDSVRVRLIPSGGGDGTQAGTSWVGSERFATGVVTSKGVVEVREDGTRTVEAR